MISRQSVEFQPLPGSDVLKTAHLFQPATDLPYTDMQRNLEEGAHRTYLENDAYNRYLHIHKVIVGEAGAEELRLLAEQLETQDLPTYLDAAGWAYAESGLASRSLSTVERVALVEKAEKIWVRSLINSVNIGENLGIEYKYGDNEGHRTALNIAYTPLIKSIIVGNVRPSILRQTFLDTAEIAHDSKISLDRAYEEKDKDAAAFHRGFLFEASALMALLYLDDARYVPFPATARGDSGYYYREQTHDISIINQHWGEIRKVIPVEIKSKASLRDKRRYHALVIQGKLRLSVGSVEAGDTAEAFYDLLHGQATTEQFVAIEQLSTQLREMLRLYQRGVSADGLAMNSLTRFHDSKKVAQFYPEHSKKPQVR